ncbi:MULTISPECIES: fimbrial protein [unclassified Paraburkholderia]|uniref:fimbrial protein n=1 Tax=unclassified Paraburkholderia TaxID=2615204 RepID=UPI000E232FC6|nr:MULTISPECIES: fimbrial protein [unclassified Paraburkholderia]REE23259.1 major type 1 subunit fimbrin (pilin) [Paraburkholderia sp. BL27I4N3]RKR37353.1 major type 1 subunit fimbrin (pilin) [Paraburkholderia sp. BL17N1]
MKQRFISGLFVVAVGAVAMLSMKAHAADGTITFTGSVSDTTCSINGVSSGNPADIAVTLPPVPAGALASANATAGTTSAGAIQMKLTGCSGAATKAVARFENGPTVDQSSGYLVNQSTITPSQNVEIRLLNANMQPINILTGANNDISANGAPISAGSATVNYFAQYFATGKAQPGSVTSSVQYTMQYQ